MKALIDKQQTFFATGETRSIQFRLRVLDSLGKMIRSYEPQVTKALQEDLNKSEFEAYTTEIGFLLEEIRFTRKHLQKWTRRRRVKSSLLQLGSKSYIYPEPYGVALIIAPWNYPFQLAIAPLIGALAAGNCAVIKPSEWTPATSRLLAQIISETFPEDYVAVVEGAVETSQALLEEKFDKIFFTGSVAVGKKVMEAAAKNLTPVTLELGGKSPCIVHKDANLPLAAKRIAWGKYLNAGQTCVAPDYVYVHRDVKEQFLTLLKQAITALYGDDVLRGDSGFTRIVSSQHFERLVALLGDGTTIHGGRFDSNSLAIEPTILDGITWDHKIMVEEIFGPILPILAYTDESGLIAAINARPKPLALYLFTESDAFQAEIIESISFGGGCVNDTLYHLTSPYLPFGGVGESGIGAYHGKGSFDAFSHEKSVLKQTTAFDIPFRYPNHKHALKWIKRLLK
ncbi:aldehyde dehydrogenase [Ammoniphilus oxalaticus]|uniref:Aldehyde dehydrogenase n=1 Tax=Ammoniphilus oxalaticus TaxID=66863 RepID=A0A419SNQ3_9BACL|nr:aldehyde dehydrogenase [Ammoniphilus oxalaticus]RKD25930.1 aldehyde dehydrogenase [Ammoniphilus oxalaticus]